MGGSRSGLAAAAVLAALVAAGGCAGGAATRREAASGFRDGLANRDPAAMARYAYMGDVPLRAKQAMMAFLVECSLLKEILVAREAEQLVEGEPVDIKIPSVTVPVINMTFQTGLAGESPLPQEDEWLELTVLRDGRWYVQFVDVPWPYAEVKMPDAPAKARRINQGIKRLQQDMLVMLFETSAQTMQSARVYFATHPWDEEVFLQRYRDEFLRIFEPEFKMWQERLRAFGAREGFEVD